MNIQIADFKRFKRFATALFGHSLVKRTTIINIYPQSDQFTIMASSQGSQIELKIPIHLNACPIVESLTLSPELLDQLCQGQGFATFSGIESNEYSSRYSVSWQHGVVSKTIEVDASIPLKLSGNVDYEQVQVDNNFLNALNQTVQVTDDSSVRYALYCVQLDGRDGSVAATDGQQMLRYTGFDFPWAEEAILIRKNKLFTLSDFVKLSPVGMGKSGDQFVLNVGSWCIKLPIQRECRFPDLNRVVPEISEVTNRIHLDGDDRQVLENCIEQLSGGNDIHQSVLVDLNGHIAIVSQSSENAQPSATLELDRSVHIGPDRKLHASRSNLQRSAKLGAKSLLVFGPGKPVIARSDNMQFIWMPLENVTSTFNASSVQTIRASSVKMCEHKSAYTA